MRHFVGLIWLQLRGFPWPLTHVPVLKTGLPTRASADEKWTHQETTQKHMTSRGKETIGIKNTKGFFLVFCSQNKHRKIHHQKTLPLTVYVDFVDDAYEFCFRRVLSQRSHHFAEFFRRDHSITVLIEHRERLTELCNNQHHNAISYFEHSKCSIVKHWSKKSLFSPVDLPRFWRNSFVFFFSHLLQPEDTANVFWLLFWTAWKKSGSNVSLEVASENCWTRSNSYHPKSVRPSGFYPLNKLHPFEDHFLHKNCPSRFSWPVNCKENPFWTIFFLPNESDLERKCKFTHLFLLSKWMLQCSVLLRSQTNLLYILVLSSSLPLPFLSLFPFFSLSLTLFLFPCLPLEWETGSKHWQMGRRVHSGRDEPDTILIFVRHMQGTVHMWQVEPQKDFSLPIKGRLNCTSLCKLSGTRWTSRLQVHLWLTRTSFINHRYISGFTVKDTLLIWITFLPVPAVC